jgi:uncharacterized protein (TIGR02246 family)
LRARRHEVLALHGRVIDAWGAGDAEAFAAPFRDDAVFVAFDGSVLVGRAQIAAAHRELFERWLKGSRLVDERTVVRFVGDDTRDRPCGGRHRPARQDAPRP